MYLSFYLLRFCRICICNGVVMGMVGMGFGKIPTVVTPPPQPGQKLVEAQQTQAPTPSQTRLKRGAPGNSSRNHASPH